MPTLFQVYKVKEKEWNATKQELEDRITELLDALGQQKAKQKNLASENVSLQSQMHQLQEMMVEGQTQSTMQLLQLQQELANALQFISQQSSENGVLNPMAV